ncbi:MAG: hypothetical protein M1821_006851 [Bathelium mastoideum]|nr:MAG: hypothetical protein M1821_006851 [Bathelium mastoideum]
MESNDRHQRQLEPAHFGSQPGLPSNTAQYAGVSASDRYRPPSLVSQSPTAATAGSRGSGNTSSYGYGYGDNSSFVGSSMHQNGMQYQSSYSESSQRNQPQQYQYGNSMMFNSQQQQQQQQPAPPQQAYESVQQYQPQENVALGVLSSQLEVPRQFFVPGEGAPTSAPAAAAMTQQQPVPSQYASMSHTYPQPAGRAPLASAYGSGMSDPTHASSHGAFGQQQDYSSVQGSAENWQDSAYEQYQTALRETFQSTRDGRLAEAAETLLRISGWLLQNAENLGLVRDDATMHAERLKLWDEFNKCWLAVLQRQKEMTLALNNTGQAPQPPESMIEHSFMERMGRDLVRFCDNLEKHGLVDYQMGIWEEEITSCKATSAGSLHALFW